MKTVIAKNYIDGVWLSSSSKIDVYAPDTGEQIGQLDYASDDMVKAAMDAAARAFTSWSKKTCQQRAHVLRECANNIRNRKAELADLLSRETGKRRPEAIGELEGCIAYLEWFAEEARRAIGEYHSQGYGGSRDLTVYKPAGVVVCLTPWNFPCSIPIRKIAPALAAGCTVVIRVSEKAPLAATELIRCLHDALCPRGVINLVHGRAENVTQLLLSHKAARIVSFTGSNDVGKRILHQATERIVRPLMELGGDAPFIVFEDADLDVAVDAAYTAKFRNNGQSCIAANQFYVAEAVYTEFCARFKRRVNAMSIGPGCAQPTPDLGPCIDEARVVALHELLNDALSRGARRLTRSFDIPQTGHYFGPTLLTDVSTDAAVSNQEIFGPLAPIHSFADERELYDHLQSNSLGLAAYAITRSQKRLWELIDNIESGILGVNNPLPVNVHTPMGGVKESGLGREGGSVGLHEFMDVQHLSINPH